jgi:hypothetical protein
MAVTELRTEPLFDALKQPLALIEGDERRRQLETYIDAARVPLERAVFDLMSQLVQAVDERVGEQYRVRLSYQPGGLGLEVDEKVQAGDEVRWSGMEGDVEKITIRIPAELKDLATQAAARAGTSANSWFIKALARSLRNMDAQQAQSPPWREERHQRGRGGRISGWVGGDDDV